MYYSGIFCQSVQDNIPIKFLYQMEFTCQDSLCCFGADKFYANEQRDLKGNEMQICGLRIRCSYLFSAKSMSVFNIQGKCINHISAYRLP